MENFMKFISTVSDNSYYPDISEYTEINDLQVPKDVHK